MFGRSSCHWSSNRSVFTFQEKKKKQNQIRLSLSLCKIETLSESHFFFFLFNPQSVGTFCNFSYSLKLVDEVQFCDLWIWIWIWVSIFSDIIRFMFLYNSVILLWISSSLENLIQFCQLRNLKTLIKVAILCVFCSSLIPTVLCCFWASFITCRWVVFCSVLKLRLLFIGQCSLNNLVSELNLSTSVRFFLNSLYP